MSKNKLVIIFLILLLFFSNINADNEDENKKIIYTNIVGSTAIITWGILNWDYGKRTMHTSKEGWFGKETKYGGMDKMGHFYTTYALSHYFAHLYSNFGFQEAKAIKQGAISSLIFNTVMEIGDSFSDYGFSYEDSIMNILGSYLGYYILMHPEIKNLIDIRIEYKPTEKIRDGDSYDVLTDYDGMKYLVAVKFDGFNSLKNTIFKYFEFHIGYFARKREGVIDRNPYISIGINLSHIFNPINKKLSQFFNYYQPPYSYISTK